MPASKSRLGRGLSGLISGGMSQPAAAKTSSVKKKPAPTKKGVKAKRKTTSSTDSTAARSKGKKAPARKTPASATSASAPQGPGVSPDPMVTPTGQLPGYREIPISRIEVSPYQPRREIAPEALEELADSIRSEGLLQPIVVRQKGENSFELIAGERRWRAGQKIRLSTITARVMEVSDASAASLALIENLQREGLDPMEEAHGYASLVRDFDLTQDAVAERVGKARASVANALRLLHLEPALQSYVSKGLLSTGHAKVLLGVEDAESRQVLARRVIEEGLSVRYLEKLVQSAKAGTPSREGKPSNGVGKNSENTAVRALEKELASHLQSRVQVQHTAKKGKLIIEYFGNEDLQRILHKMGMPH